jgi:hypothetical protein
MGLRDPDDSALEPHRSRHPIANAVACRTCNTPQDLEPYGRLFQTFLNSPAMKA